MGAENRGRVRRGVENKARSDLKGNRVIAENPAVERIGIGKAAVSNEECFRGECERGPLDLLDGAEFDDSGDAVHGCPGDRCRDDDGAVRLFKAVGDVQSVQPMDIA